MNSFRHSRFFGLMETREENQAAIHKTPFWKEYDKYGYMHMMLGKNQYQVEQIDFRNLLNIYRGLWRYWKFKHFREGK